MCSLANNLRYRLAAAFGVWAFAFPEQAPWAALAALLMAFCIAWGSSGRSRLVIVLVSAGMFLSVAGGLISAAFVAAVLAAIAIAPHNRLMALTILALQTSYAASFEAMAANYLFRLNLEAAAPALIAGCLVFAAQHRLAWWRAALVVLPLPIVWTAQAASLAPLGLLMAAALPPILLAALSTCDNRLRLTGRPLIAAAILVLLGAIGWAITPPKVHDAGYVVLPGSLESPEARFYLNYPEVLKFAGLEAKVVDSIEDIPPQSLVLLPWLTAVDQRETAPSYARLRKLALERGWTVVMIGEHTNMGGVADRVATVSNRAMLRNDLSVPLNNTDVSGHMRIAGIRAWFPDAMLNRGASVEVRSPLDRVLLSGDGWWAEPDIGEWLWVGDYLWQKSDRHGRLVMAASVDEGSARWVVLGDTGPFINQQLTNDPRPAARVLELASLWPLFVRDAGLLIIATAIALGLAPVGLASVAGLLVVSVLLSASPEDGPWRSLWRQESSFDERNFNRALTDSPALLTSDWAFVHPKGPLPSRLPLPERPTVLFGLVESELLLSGVRLSNCKRLGSLSTDTVRLMDAQACKVEGVADVLIGDRNEAAILRIGEGGSTLILVLDQNFLGHNAPILNRRWLEQMLVKR